MFPTIFLPFEQFTSKKISLPCDHPCELDLGYRNRLHCVPDCCPLQKNHGVDTRTRYFARHQLRPRQWCIFFHAPVLDGHRLRNPGPRSSPEFNVFPPKAQVVTIADLAVCFSRLSASICRFVSSLDTLRTLPKRLSKVLYSSDFGFGFMEVVHASRCFQGKRSSCCAQT